LRRVKLQQTIEKGIAQGAKSLFLFAGFPTLGNTGDGKSTSLAALIDIISRERSCRIFTVDDPIEYLFRPHQSVISRRETYSLCDH
jgi:Tfp pilus assembly pilus retraction ATPase PilT